MPPGEALREAILDAAERLMARYGYKKMTVDDLAQEVGIGKGTIYLYFPSKEEVALTIIDRIVARVMERLQRHAASPSSPAENLRQMLVDRVLIRIDSVQRYSESIDELFRALRPAVLARRRRYFEEEAAVVASVVREGQRRGMFEPGDPLSTAQALLIATNSLLPSSLSTRELGEREEIEARTTQIVDLLLAGLLRRAEPTSVEPASERMSDR